MHYGLVTAFCSTRLICTDYYYHAVHVFEVWFSGVPGIGRSNILLHHYQTTSTACQVPIDSSATHPGNLKHLF
jgi:hypothetical protein